MTEAGLATGWLEGDGGGGGGGTILVDAKNFIGNTLINVSGGKGADLVIYNTFGGGRVGPGGGGGGDFEDADDAMLFKLKFT